jgi:hypothetical protein
MKDELGQRNLYPIPILINARDLVVLHNGSRAH